MCGIVGYSGMFSSKSLESAKKALSHRGSDEEGLWVSNSQLTGLAHQRLSIIDLSSLGSQPMYSEDRFTILVFNGEIYNFLELKEELLKCGVVFKGDSDTEVLLQLYLVYGEKMLSMLNGIFSFAIWNEKKQSLFLARDPLGVKPLYYAEVNKGFCFSSEIKSLLKFFSKTDDLILDQDSIHRYMTFLWNPGEGTPLKIIKKLNPGAALIVRKGRVERNWSWYQLPIFRNITASLSKDESILGVTKHLRKAVHSQLVSDVPVGAFLSGGLDSSAIVALAREVLPDIQCFTIKSTSQDKGATDDLPYAKKVAKHLNVSLDIVEINANQMADNLVNMIMQLDEPLADPAPLNVLYISELARTHGIKVLLSGSGGDDIFTGYRRHIAVNNQYLWQWLPRFIRTELEEASTYLNQNKALQRRITKLFSGCSLDGNERLASYFHWIREVDLLKLYTPSFRESLIEKTASRPMMDFLTPLASTVKPLDKILALEQRFFLSDHNLTYTDKMSMAVGLEVRVPFLDKNLIDFAQKIPLKYKQKGNISKWVLKKAMEPYLPKDVIYRPKAGFGAPLRGWMQNELRPLLGDILSEESLKKRGIFEYEKVQQLVRDNTKGTIDASYTLLSLLSIEIWCRAYLDKNY